MIITPDQRLRVFVSSTLDLHEARRAARSAIESLHLTPVMFEAGARPHPPRALYRAYVEQSDVFVAVYATRYGWTAPGMDVSGLEDEYNLSTGKPRLVYVQAANREPELEAFLGRVQDDGLSYKPFTAAEQLEELLQDDLVVLLTERFHASADEGGHARGAPPAPLPVPATAFLGREPELADVAALLRDEAVRLVTLVGPGGIGKTRLAIESARRLTPDFPRGIFFVSLADLREPDLIADVIAADLQVSTSDAYPAVAAVEELLRDGPVLLVLDNFEHVAGGAAVVIELLSACPRLNVLATSRAPLRIRGEHELEVMPLAVPDASVSTDHLGDFSAVQLFVESARAVRPGFALDDRTAPAVAEICRQLDALPLAIELAAAMTRVLTPQMLLERLRDWPTELGAGLRDLPPRHRNLTATIAWSYDLLDARTREVFAQLSVFRGGFTLEAAERICQVDGDLLAAVASLTEQSLLRARVDAAQGPRFSMLGTVRRFAWTRLAESRHREAVLAAHARMFVEIAGTVARPGGRQAAVLDVVETELDNVRGAFEWLLASDEPDPVAAAMWDSWWFWWTRGYLREGKLWSDRCTAAPALGRTARGQALSARAMFAIWSGEYEVAVPAFEEAVEIARGTGDAGALAYADVGLGVVHAITRSVGEGGAVIRRGVAQFEAAGDDVGATTALAALSWVQAITRDFDTSDEIIRQAVQRAQASNAEMEMGITKSALAQFHMADVVTVDVLDLMGESLEHLCEARHIASVMLTLEVIAELGLRHGAARGAATILGATGAMRSAMGTRLPPTAGARLEQMIASGRAQLEDGFDEAFGSGSELRFLDAVDRGRAVLTEVRATIDRSAVAAPDA